MRMIGSHAREYSTAQAAIQERIRPVDLLDHKCFNIANASTVRIDVHCGMFRFMDIETKESFQ